MNESEMKDFFSRTFGSVRIRVSDEALPLLCRYSAGFPKIMHVVGDNIFWIDEDGIVDKSDAVRGIVDAAGDIGRKFVDQQVYNALRSKDYHSILAKISKEKLDLAFRKCDIEKGLSENEKKKLNNFLQRMKKLKVLRSGEEKGEWVFLSRLVRLYIGFKSLER